ncbi:hypothetical protein Tsubulata_009053 [Turnera subulata]|uniref:RING-type E3 ubiquitin transferase n=1 Tax=Turnera subulata TaxID=218843 RepID=A0A9Q0G3D6_9ROSI|nr:hypothetical protein Tsubulata_009053 [Turnera subulata]
MGATNNGGAMTAEPSRFLPAPPPTRPEASPFRPSIAVVVAVLTTMFSVTFLLLLYARHCKRDTTNGSGGGGGYGTGDLMSGRGGSSYERKNSGIDRGVIESLPIFRFSSLMGQKEGLDCAVCLTKFEPADVLRLLPKCKHAFHVECVDTWLDAHSTCPLCRYRVDPEDILLIETATANDVVGSATTGVEEEASGDHGGDIESGVVRDGGGGAAETGEYRRISGRHSSAGEGGSKLRGDSTTSFRRSLDGLFRKKSNNQESVTGGCFDRQRSERKDGLLLTKDTQNQRNQVARVEHRIVVSEGGSRKSGGGGFHFHQRWSDVQPSDLLYLRSEMIISDGRRSSASGSRPSVSKLRHGRNVINERSVSEITGVDRFAGRSSIGSSSNYNRNNGNETRRHQHRERQAGDKERPRH